MRAYSMDLRERVMAALDEGESSLEVASRLGVHDSWVRKLRRRRDRTGTIAPAPHGGGRVALGGARRLGAKAAATRGPWGDDGPRPARGGTRAKAGPELRRGDSI